MPTDSFFSSTSSALIGTGRLGSNNTRDSYGFTLSSTQDISFSLSGLQGDADLRLFRASSVNGEFETTEELGSSLNSSTTNESINRVLNPGIYVVQVDAFRSATTNYRVEVAANLTDRNPKDQFEVGALTGSQTFAGRINSTNTVDAYRFSINATSELNFSLTGMSGDADLRVGRDANGNGTLETSEIIAKSFRYYNFNESINLRGVRAQGPGDYIVEVYKGPNQPLVDTHYRLGLRATPTAASTSQVDLTGDIINVSGADFRRADTRGFAQVKVRNDGIARAAGVVRVNLYASTDNTYDSNDELLGSQTLDLSLFNGQSTTYDFTFGLPTGVAPGSYKLLARIDTDNALRESNELNNTTAYHMSAPGTDVILAWNATLLNAFQAVDTAPPIAARNQAIVHAAMFDAINIIERRYQSFHIDPTTFDRSLTNGASTTAAAAQAAYQIVLDLQPGAAVLEEARLQLERSLQDIPEGDAKQRGIDIGQQVADIILRDRRNDGALGAQDRYVPGTAPGSYQPTNADRVVGLAGFGNVQTFVIPSADRFTPGGPPIYGSNQYAIELNEVQRLGGVTSSSRTNDQTQIATFWAYDRPDTFRPPAQWNQIAEVESLRSGLSTLENARMFAQLNVAQADAGIVAWNTKYRYNQLRPVSAVRAADNDGNFSTVGDANWQSFLATPPFPDYISGHSTFGAAAGEVLSNYFGSNHAFQVTSQEIPGIYRSFQSFQQAADENGRSRIYGGVHVESANRDGLAAGRAVARYVLQNSFLAA
jgi:hypothetical protein